MFRMLLLNRLRLMVASAVTTLILGCSAVPNRADVEKYIVDSERAWAESVASGDTTILEKILADDFVGVDPDGSTYNKATMIKETKTAPQYFISNHLNYANVRFFGDTAVVQGNESWVRRSGESRCGSFAWTDTWIRRNGSWQIVAAEDLIVPEKCK